MGTTVFDLLVSVLVIACAAALLATIVSVARFRRRRAAGAWSGQVCVRCGYVLQGATGPRCAECGADLASRGVVAAWQRGHTARCVRWWFGGPVAAAVVLLGVLYFLHAGGTLGTVLSRSVTLHPAASRIGVESMLLDVRPAEAPAEAPAGQDAIADTGGRAGASEAPRDTTRRVYDVTMRLRIPAHDLERTMVTALRPADAPMVLDRLWDGVVDEVEQHLLDPQLREDARRTADELAGARSALDAALRMMADWIPPVFEDGGTLIGVYPFTVASPGGAWTGSPFITAVGGRAAERLLRPWMLWTALAVTAVGAGAILVGTRSCRRGVPLGVPRTCASRRTASMTPHADKGDERESNPRPPEPQSGALTD